MKWLSGWLPLSLGLFILTFFYSRRLFGLLVVAVMILAIINLPFIMSVLNAENSESGVTRLGAWQNALAVTGEHYLFGTGPAGYHFYFRLFLIDLYQLSHNNYIDIIAQTGIIGFTVWIWFWLSMSRETWRMWRVIPRGNFLHGLGIALVACHICTFVIMMLGDWVTPFTYTQGLDGIDYTIWAWILAGMTVSVFYLSRPRATSPSAA